MNCFHCRRQIELTERIGFRALCAQCDRPLHVCLNCDLYDSTFNNQCRETQAERVVDKDRANFCEYFSPRKSSGATGLSPQKDVRAKLDDLFKKKASK
jgi:hypothetical protein